MRFRTKLPVCHPTKFFIKGFLEAEESKTKNPGFRPKCRKSLFFRTFFVVEIFDFKNFQNSENLFFEKIIFHFGKIFGKSLSFTYVYQKFSVESKKHT